MFRRLTTYLLGVLLLVTACGTDPTREPQVIETTAEPLAVEDLTATVESIRADLLTEIALSATPTPIDVSQLPTIPAGSRPTLPATWTPTATATITTTPTITDTPSVTPTLSADAICAENTLGLSIIEDGVYTRDDSIQVVIDLEDPAATGTLVLTSEATGAEETLAFTGGQNTLGLLSLDLESGPGEYTWRTFIATPAYDVICEQNGAFTLRVLSPAEVMQQALEDVQATARAAPVTPVVEASPEVTSEATAEATQP